MKHGAERLFLMGSSLFQPAPDTGGSAPILPIGSNYYRGACPLPVSKRETALEVSNLVGMRVAVLIRNRGVRAIAHRAHEEKVKCWEPYF
jgi:hypothetical protein